MRALFDWCLGCGLGMQTPGHPQPTWAMIHDDRAQGVNSQQARCVQSYFLTNTTQLVQKESSKQVERLLTNEGSLFKR